ncbi:hypothetical protein MKZ38_010319 [Zalerion maritima]|uniref:BZIP domain-containing protein n=1 Tax=Zalerion maritima TaxID=339359 RepID=A0AAD5WYB6_9PEZI|nr:hypothetical protein MKZ38_010319 [Zalerion maritima]
MADRMSIDKKDPTRDESDDSMVSSPEDDHHHQSAGGSNHTTNTSAAASINTTTPQETQAPKRKGGRKPVLHPLPFYGDTRGRREDVKMGITDLPKMASKERKQRNRQAQAAFRERRTEYIKQLEETIRVHESNLHNLQAAHRSAADECLMLRYKNSLLERILLEKGDIKPRYRNIAWQLTLHHKRAGIDVQAELRDKTGSPTLGPTHVPQNMVQPPPIHRAILNRHQSRRSASSIAPKIEPGVSTLPPSTHARSSAASPKSQPTPSNHSNSPTAGATPGYTSQMGPTSMGPEPVGLRAAVTPMKPMPMGANTRPMAPTTNNQPFRVGGGGPGPFYPTPSFQNHIEQLGKLTQQEYDAQNDMIDDPEAETPGPGPYPAGYANEPQPMVVSPTTGTPASTTTAGSVAHLPPLGAGQSQAPPGQYPSMTQLLDPSLDWDPFGLSASMQFPTQFTFDTSNMR